MKLLEDFFVEKIEEFKQELVPYLIDVFGKEYSLIIKERLLSTKIFIHHGMMTTQNIKSIKSNGNKYQVKDINKFNSIMDKLLEEYSIVDNINNTESIYQELCEEYFPTYKRIFLPLKFILGVDALINTKKSKDYFKNSRREKRIIDYYNILGLNLGNKLEDYLNNEEAKKLTISKTKGKEFLEKYKLLEQKYHRLFDSFNDNSKSLMEVLNKEEYDVINVFNKDINNSYCLANTKNSKNVPMCFIELKDIINGNDDVIIHELIHAVTLESKFKCGIRVGNKFQSLNETITETLTNIIFEKIKKDNKVILYDESTITKSSYYIANNIGKAFISKYKNHLGEILLKSEKEIHNIFEDDFLMNLDKVCQGMILLDYMHEDFYVQGEKKGIDLINKYGIKRKNQSI